MFTCIFCEKEFSSAGSLKTHTLKTKYCIKIQDEKNINKQDINNETKKDIYNCIHCNKEFYYNFNKTKHEKICKVYKNNKVNEINEKIEKLNEKIEKLKEENEDKIKILKEENEDKIKILKEENECKLKSLKEKNKENECKLKNLKEDNIRLETENKCLIDRLNDTKEDKKYINDTMSDITNKTVSALATKNTNTTVKTTKINNNITNYLNLSEEKIKLGISTYTMDDYNNGQKGLADLVFNNILKDENGKILYICTDKSRRIFCYTDVNGDQIRDEKASNLKSIINPIMKPVIAEIAKQKRMELSEIDDDDCSMLDRTVKLATENKDSNLLILEKRLVTLCG